MSDLYPWLDDPWKRVTRSWDRHTHGQLFTGPVGIGKRQFAQTYAQARLCEHVDVKQKPCGVCRNCALFLAGTHPDFHVLLSDADTAREDLSLLANYAIRHPSKSVISVDQIRSIISGLSTAAHSSQYKIVLIAPAENMNINAANALLKLLEEPPQHTMLLLVSEATFRLPATIRSRCSQFKFATPDVQIATSWLEKELTKPGEIPVEEIVQITNGAPLVAKNLIDNKLYPRIQEIMQTTTALVNGQGDPLSFAAYCKESPGVNDSLKWLHQSIAALIRTKFGSGIGAENTPDTPRTGLRNNDLQQLFAIYDKITQAKGYGDSPLDPILLLEDTLVSMTQVR